MTYTRTWDVTSPTGQAQASTIDDIFRSMKTDILERMNDLVTNWTATTGITLKTSGVGARSVVGRNVPFSAGIATGTFTIEANADYIQTTGANSFDLVMPVIVPVGATLQFINIAAFRDTNSTITSTLRRNQTSGASNQVASAPFGPVSQFATITLVSACNHVQVNEEWFTVKCSCVGSAAGSVIRVLGMAYYYDIPSFDVR